MREVFVRVGAVVLAGMAWTAAASGPLLLADTKTIPHVTIAWTDATGERVVLEADRPYSADAGREAMGRNISSFVAMGGVRLTKNAGHPEGAIVRAGFYKINMMQPFFGDMNPDSVIEITLSNVRFNRGVDPNLASPVQHLKFMPGPIEKLGLSLKYVNQYNTANEIDLLAGRIEPGIDTKMGALGGAIGTSFEGAGSVELTEQDDGSITMVAKIPYRLLRHLQDPAAPGDKFIEPMHFHVEFEALPDGVKPLDLTEAFEAWTSAQQEGAQIEQSDDDDEDG